MPVQTLCNIVLDNHTPLLLYLLEQEYYSLKKQVNNTTTTIINQPSQIQLPFAHLLKIIFNHIECSSRSLLNFREFNNIGQQRGETTIERTPLSTSSRLYPKDYVSNVDAMPNLFFYQILPPVMFSIKLFPLPLPILSSEYNNRIESFLEDKNNETCGDSSDNDDNDNNNNDDNNNNNNNDLCLHHAFCISSLFDMKASLDQSPFLSINAIAVSDCLFRGHLGCLKKLEGLSNFAVFVNAVSNTRCSPKVLKFLFRRDYWKFIRFEIQSLVVIQKFLSYYNSRELLASYYTVKDIVHYLVHSKGKRFNPSKISLGKEGTTLLLQHLDSAIAEEDLIQCCHQEMSQFLMGCQWQKCYHPEVVDLFRKSLHFALQENLVILDHMRRQYHQKEGEREKNCITIKIKRASMYQLPAILLEGKKHLFEFLLDKCPTAINSFWFLSHLQDQIFFASTSTSTSTSEVKPGKTDFTLCVDQVDRLLNVVRYGDTKIKKIAIVKKYVDTSNSIFDILSGETSRGFPIEGSSKDMPCLSSLLGRSRLISIQEIINSHSCIQVKFFINFLFSNETGILKEARSSFILFFISLLNSPCSSQKMKAVLLGISPLNLDEQLLLLRKLSFLTPIRLLGTLTERIKEFISPVVYRGWSSSSMI